MDTNWYNGQALTLFWTEAKQLWPKVKLFIQRPSVETAIKCQLLIYKKMAYFPA